MEHPNASKQRFVYSDGVLSIVGDDMLYVTFDDVSRAIQFLSKRGEGSELIEFLEGLELFPGNRVDQKSKSLATGGTTTKEEVYVGVAMAALGVTFAASIVLGPEVVAAFILNEAKDEVLSQATNGASDIFDASKILKNTIEKGAKKFYRYVGEGEKAVIDKTGKIPNTDAEGNPKEIYFTDRDYKTAGRAKTHNQLPNKPSYKIEIDPNNVEGETEFTKVNPTDNPQWGIGGGREATTPSPIKVDPNKITKLKGG